MQVVEFTEGTLRFLDSPPTRLHGRGFCWIFLDRDAWVEELPLLQDAARRLGGSSLLDLHVRDLSNAAHPSHYDYTSVYDLVLFRRLATAREVEAELGPPPAIPRALASFERIRTRAVGFVVFDRLLITVHPAGCESARSFIERYAAEAVHNEKMLMLARSRLPNSPADLMLRMINVMVDGYLELRKQLATDLEQWQAVLLEPHARETDWRALMLARGELHQLEDICEDQNDAIQEWLDTTREQPPRDLSQADRDALAARAVDVIEHIQRVVHQVRRLETGAEAAVQIHFSAQSHRTNNIMRTLTVVTAIFLPLNLVTGIFGMNFEYMPLLHRQTGFWLALVAMLAVAVGLGVFFWRKRYLARTGR